MRKRMAAGYILGIKTRLREIAPCRSRPGQVQGLRLVLQSGQKQTYTEGQGWQAMMKG